MSSLSTKDRVSLCSFTFADGPRCRTPRNRNHPHFCFYHAQKEARATAPQKLVKDLAYFFSGDYLSACDLSTALARLIPAVVPGDVKPRAARTVAYMVLWRLEDDTVDRGLQETVRRRRRRRPVSAASDGTGLSDTSVSTFFLRRLEQHAHGTRPRRPWLKGLIVVDVQHQILLAQRAR